MIIIFLAFFVLLSAYEGLQVIVYAFPHAARHRFF
jgi:hypothetical protein